MVGADVIDAEVGSFDVDSLSGGGLGTFVVPTACAADLIEYGFDRLQTLDTGTEQVVGGSCASPFQHLEPVVGTTIVALIVHLRPFGAGPNTTRRTPSLRLALDT
jgi:hypothetical protein